MTLRPVRVGLIGYGVSGAVFHAPLIAATRGLRLDAIVTRDPKRRQAARLRYPETRIVSDVAALWRRGGLDVIVVATPNRSHVALAEQALGEGIPVIVDKPLAVSSTHARRLVGLAQSGGLPLSVFQNRRWDSDFRTLTRVLARGALGTPLRVESSFELYRPLQPEVWRESGDPEDGGGVLFDLGSHLIDQAMVLFGRPTTVYCEMHRRRPGAVVDDDTFVSLAFGDLTCRLSMGKCSRATGPRFRVTGSEGSFEIAGMDAQWPALQRGDVPGRPSWGRHPSNGILTTGDGVTLERRQIRPLSGTYHVFYQKVRDALVGRGQMPVDPGDSVDVLTIIETARLSAEEGRAIAIDAVHENEAGPETA